jgi:hypothetical protein
MKFKLILTAALLNVVGSQAFAEVVTPNEHVIQSITNKEAFNRVFYTTIQTVINSHPTTGLYNQAEENPSNPRGLNPATIQTGCYIGEDGDTYCSTDYELYDGLDKLIATIDVHSSGKIEKSLNAGGLPSATDVKTGMNSGGNDLILSEDGGLSSVRDNFAVVKTIRDHF